MQSGEGFVGVVGLLSPMLANGPCSATLSRAWPAPTGATHLLRAWWHVTFSLCVFLAGEEFVHLGLEEFAVFGIHHVQAAFVDQQGLVLLPFVPRLLGDVVEDVFTFGAWVRWAL